MAPRGMQTPTYRQESAKRGAPGGNEAIAKPVAEAQNIAF